MAKKLPEEKLRAVLERILEEIHTMPTPCWLWTGSDSGNGYGRVSVEGKTRAVHIIVWEHFNGPVPEGLVLDHECRNRLCCNPNHLTPRTVLDNTLRGEGPTAKNAAKTHCLRGHELSGDNLIVRIRQGRPSRECRACKRFRAVPWRRRRVPELAESHPCPQCSGSGSWDAVAAARDNQTMACACRGCQGLGVAPERREEALRVLLSAPWKERSESPSSSSSSGQPPAA